MTIARVGKRLWYAAATMIILAALLVSGGRLLTPYFNDHLPDIESWASRLINAQIKIGNVYLTWNIYEPELTFDQVQFIDPVSRKPTLQIEHASVNLAILRSLFERRLVVGDIRFSGSHLSVQQNATGKWNIEGLAGVMVTDKATGTSLQANQLLGWVFSVPSLILENIDIEFHPDKGPARFFILNSLALNNSDKTHTIVGRGVLNQIVPTKVKLNLTWEGDISDLSHISVQSYTYLEGVDLSQWFGRLSWKDLQIKEGLGSAKIWMKWANDSLQECQTRVQLYALTVNSSATQKKLTIPRLNGHFGWKRDGEKQIFAGEQIFLDLPTHLWPETSFTVIASMDKEGGLVPESIIATFFDINDIKEIAAMSGLVPSDVNKKIQLLNPSGEIRDFQLTINPVSQTDITKAYTITAGFKGLSFNAWEKLPGITNMSGLFSWDGKKALLNLNSQQLAVNIKQYFSDSLHFDKLVGFVTYENDANNNATYSIKNVSAENVDIKLQGEMNLTIPANDSPVIDASADFQAQNVAHLSHYMPMKLFDSKLAQWIRAAFLGGQLNSGKLIFQGSLANFPFVDGKGKFTVKGAVANVDFRYAPDWPIMQQVMGNISLTGSAMTIDVDSANILGIPINSTHATINNFGVADPQLLTVHSDIKSDLASGMRFIHQSLLQKTIGKDLEGMDLQGPMQLKLAVTVPLASPDKAAVIGDVIMTNTKMALAGWKLSMENMQGLLHFTERDIEAKELRGKLFGSDALLSIQTLHPENKPSFVQANLQSRLAVSTLQSWVKMPLASLAQGSGAFLAELRLYSQRQSGIPAELTIHSNLQGMSLTLPEELGKSAQESRDLQIDMLAQQQKIRVKLNYNKVLTAALDFQKEVQGLGFYSGEVSLGGEAEWQKLPGLVLSGVFKQLDFDNLQSKFSSNQSSAINTSLVRSIHLEVDAFHIFGQKLNRAHIQLSKANNNWTANIESNEVLGQVTIPPSNSNQALQGRFQHIYLKTNKDSKEQVVNIKKIPPISIVINDMRYDDKNLGTLTLNATPSQYALDIRELRIQSPLVDLRAQGEWRVLNGRHVSHLTGTLATMQLSDLLNAWGVGISSLVSRKADVNFDLHWPGPIYDPSLPTMSGKMSLSVAEGRVINLSDSNRAKMDLGRLLNLFSLNALPRHLSVDSSNNSNTEKGYDFDFIKGDFIIDNGNAITENTHIDGPIAGIHIAGRIGLVAKNVNIKLEVTPYVTSSISTVVAIASLNPIAGVAALVVDKMIGHAVSKAVTYHYNVSGSWNNPVWNQQQ